MAGVLFELIRVHGVAPYSTHGKDLAMRNISIDDINAAILNGGAGSLLVRVELEPASGLDGIIAPAKYAGANNATYVLGEAVSRRGKTSESRSH